MVRPSLTAVILCLAAIATAAGDEFADLSGAVRTALGQRDFATAKEKLDALKAAAKSDGEQDTAERLELLHGYVLDFWKSVDEAGRKLRGLDELEVNGKRVVVVEYVADEATLIIRVDGQNKRYTKDNIPLRLAMAIAERVLKSDAPENQVLIGALLAMDGKGDRGLAKAAWDKAAKAGIDVKKLLPELGADVPAASSITLPTLTKATAATLRPTQWQAITAREKGWQRGPLGERGAQDALTGRLALEMPADHEVTWIAWSANMPKNFGLRMYLTNIPPGQQFALITNEGDLKSLAEFELPAGTVKVELARTGGKFLCKVNDADQDVKVLEANAGTAAGRIAFTLPAKAKCGVAGLEVK